MPTYQPMAPITYWLLFMASAFVTFLLLVITWFAAPLPGPNNDTASPSVLPLALEATLGSYHGDFHWTLDDEQIAQICLEDTLEQTFGMETANPTYLTGFFPDNTADQSSLIVHGFTTDPDDWAKWHHHHYCKACNPDDIPATLSKDDITAELQHRLWEQSFCTCMNQDPAIPDPLEDCALGILETLPTTSIVATWKSSSGGNAKMEESLMQSCLLESYETSSPSSTKLTPSWSVVAIEDTRETVLEDSILSLTSVKLELVKKNPTWIGTRGGVVHRSTHAMDMRPTGPFWSNLCLSELWGLYRYHVGLEEEFCGCFQTGSEQGANVETCQINVFLPQDSKLSSVW